MHRAGSTTRASDEFYLMSSQQGGRPTSTSVMEVDQLPTYDPQSHVFKKEAVKARFAENMVHLIPLILILCAFALWFFSHPELDVVSKDGSMIAIIKNMTIEDYSNSNWNSSTIPNVGMEDLDPIDGIGMEDPGKDLDSKDPEFLRNLK